MPSVEPLSTTRTSRFGHSVRARRLSRQSRLRSRLPYVTMTIESRGKASAEGAERLSTPGQFCSVRRRSARGRQVGSRARTSVAPNAVLAAQGVEPLERGVGRRDGEDAMPFRRESSEGALVVGVRRRQDEDLVAIVERDHRGARAAASLAGSGPIQSEGGLRPRRNLRSASRSGAGSILVAPSGPREGDDPVRPQPGASRRPRREGRSAAPGSGTAGRARSGAGPSRERP